MEAIKLLLERLDYLLVNPPSEEEGYEVTYLMEDIITTAGTDGLILLVERYGNSQVPIFPRATSFLLAQQADHPDENTTPLVYELINKLQCQDDWATQINCLTILQCQTMFDLPWTSLSQAQSVLFPFVQYCLSQHVTVVEGVVDALHQLNKRGLIQEVFTETQIAALRQRFREIIREGDTHLNKKIAYLNDLIP
ncbi:hypothetical protein Cylst_4133 [Cylindrospermum stagnale PCC 7417]|uniref:Uncharacterized protein n=1 Tax=Cylindrospermum stagnale PCC 7417 TaxID=56107 RepID=K9X184_9NOST|nr:hypothetical protein [Cylindrospermum stagnale]AFZ26238.1 hypothetical protein Cylst_4133 [Cylindrospermum stagnale PCC 7417]